MKLTSLLLLALAALPASLVHAQDRNGPPGPPPGPPPHPVLQLITALDTDGDGILSAAEIANATASLKTLDKNGDGELTPDEYGPEMTSGTTGAMLGRGGMPTRGGMRMHQGPPPPHSFEDMAIVRVLDTAGDGTISAEGIANAPALLKTLDKNDDGQLSPLEYGRKPRPLVAALDEDGDGIISASEIANAATALKTLDKNGDGTLTANEYNLPMPEPPSQSGTSGRTTSHGSRNSGNDQQEPPEDPLLTALDTDGDGTLSAAEIAAASASLATLDKNGDGQLGPGEYDPAPPSKD